MSVGVHRAGLQPLVLPPSRQQRCSFGAGWQHDDYYCITTGWMDPLLSTIGFWKHLETLVRCCETQCNGMPFTGLPTVPDRSRGIPYVYIYIYILVLYCAGADKHDNRCGPTL
jgi:hypothetical protein